MSGSGEVRVKDTGMCWRLVLFVTFQVRIRHLFLEAFLVMFVLSLPLTPEQSNQISCDKKKKNKSGVCGEGLWREELVCFCWVLSQSSYSGWFLQVAYPLVNCPSISLSPLCTSILVCVA